MVPYKRWFGSTQIKIPVSFCASVRSLKGQHLLIFCKLRRKYVLHDKLVKSTGCIFYPLVVESFGLQSFHSPTVSSQSQELEGRWPEEWLFTVSCQSVKQSTITSIAFSCKFCQYNANMVYFYHTTSSTRTIFRTALASDPTILFYDSFLLRLTQTGYGPSLHCSCLFSTELTSDRVSVW